MKVFPCASGPLVSSFVRASFLLIATVAATSHAQSALTRDQVKVELREAIRTGDISAGGESNLKLNQLYPGRYPKTAGMADSAGASHAMEAVRGSSVYANGEFGVAGQEYPAAVAGALDQATRAQVKAETLEAIAAGEIVSGELGQSLNEGAPRHFAKRRSEVHIAAPKGMPAGDMMN